MARSLRSGSDADFTKQGWRRRVLVRLAALLAILLGATVILGVWVARALPGIAAAEISRLTSTRIEMGAFNFSRNASVSIDGMVIRPEREDLFYDDTILRAKSVYAKFSLGSLLLLSPRVTEIRIDADDGNDTITITGSEGSDTASLSAGSVEVEGPAGVHHAVPDSLLLQVLGGAIGA